MTPTGNERDICLASTGWDSDDCDSVTNASIGFIEGVAECLRAMDSSGATDAFLRKMGETLADAASTVTFASHRRKQIRKDAKKTARDKFFFNHLDEDGWELYKNRFRGTEKDEEGMRQAFEDMLGEKSVSTGTNILKDL